MFSIWKLSCVPIALTVGLSSCLKSNDSVKASHALGSETIAETALISVKSVRLELGELKVEGTGLDKVASAAVTGESGRFDLSIASAQESSMTLTGKGNAISLMTGTSNL